MMINLEEQRRIAEILSAAGRKEEYQDRRKIITPLYHGTNKLHMEQNRYFKTLLD